MFEILTAVFLSSSISIAGVSYMSPGTNEFTFDVETPEEFDVSMIVPDLPPGGVSLYSGGYLKGYYKHLLKNFDDNQMGSCAYIAMQMILSYFDSIWNDNTISENFDVLSSNITSYADINSNVSYPQGSDYNSINSPGAGDLTSDFVPSYIFQDDNMTTYQKNYNYYNALCDIPNNFQAYLMLSYAEDFGYIDLYSPNCFALSGAQVYTILSNYLIDESLSSVYDLYFYNNNSYTSLERRNIIINNITNGYPVFVGANYNYYSNVDNDWHNASHALVAYEYDSVNDYIYGHTGYYAHTHANVENYNLYELLNYTVLDSFYLNYYSCAIVLVPKTYTHVHSNNYIINNIVTCLLG